MNDPTVIVVGAGPAGMLLALLLARSGIRVVVLEQATTFARDFRGELLQPGAIKIFEDLGLRDRILALGGEFPSGVDVHSDRERMSFDFQASQVTRPGGIAIVPQQQLLEVLAEEVARYANSKLIMGCSIRELLSDARGVVGVKGQMRGGQPIELRATIVFACDGRFSTIRRAAGIKLREKPVAFDLLWFSTAIPRGFSNRAYVRDNARRTVCLICQPQQ